MKTRSAILALASASAAFAAIAPSASAAPSGGLGTPVGIGDFRHFSGSYTSAAQCNYYHDGITKFATHIETSADGKHTSMTSGIKSIGNCHVGTSGKWTYGVAVYTSSFTQDAKGNYVGLYYAGDKPSSWQMFTHNSATYKDEATCKMYRNAAIKRATNAGGWANAAVNCYNKTWNMPGQPKQPDAYSYAFVDYYAPHSLSAGDKARSVYNLNDAPPVSIVV